MLNRKAIDRICIIAAIAAVVITAVFMNGEKLGISRASAHPPYEEALFDDSYVHNINIEIDDPESFFDSALEEEYVRGDITIDGEKFSAAGIRVKGNNSKNLITKYGLDRYSLKIEFDHYDEGGSYYGLDKMSLDCAFQDNSYMKNYLAYDMMRFMGVPAPLTSYTWVTINGQDYGLFLAVEEPEEAFIKRNFGNSGGKMYKPDYKSLEDENRDVALMYSGQDPAAYDNIFRTAKTDIDLEDQQRLIESLRILAEGDDLAQAVNIDQVIRYFTVQVFVVNLDSYLGPTGHNYFLYEEDGLLSMIPWDYNLAFATYSLGMPEPINDAELYINYPIDTPASGDVMLKRPMYHNLMLQEENFDLYHQYFDQFIAEYFESGRFEELVGSTVAMIGTYVEKDPTAFCSYEDFLTGAETIRQFCLLRAQSVRGQLDGIIPSTIRGQAEDDSKFVDGSSVWLPDMGEIADLERE